MNTDAVVVHNSNSPTAETTLKSGVVVIPPNFDVQINCSAQKVAFDELQLNILNFVSFA